MHGCLLPPPWMDFGRPACQLKEIPLQNEQQGLTLRSRREAMKPRRALLLAALMVSLSLSGCFGEPEVEVEEVNLGVWTFERPELTWYHFPDAVDAWGNTSFAFSGRNMPYLAEGTYYSIGMSTFEPTMGITESDTLFMSSYGNGPAGSTVVACDLIGMTGTVDYTCENVYDPILPIANSNDPYIYVTSGRAAHEVRCALSG